MTSDRGAVLNGPGEDVSIEPIRVDPPGPGEVCVRIVATGVCHTDLHVKATNGWGMPFPILLGHEGASYVEALGPGVEGLAEGDPVVVSWLSPCGRCPACIRGDPRRCSSPLRAEQRAHRASDGALLAPVLRCGTFATRAVVHAADAVKMPPGMPLEKACLLACSVSTGTGAVLHTSPVWAGAAVAVIGCGAVGLSAVQGARLAGAGTIIAVDLRGGKLETALRLGATDTVDASSDDVAERVRAITEGAGVDFSFDVVGSPASLADAIRILGHAGTATLVGLPSPETQASLPLERLFMKKATIRVSHGGDSIPAGDFPVLAGLYLEGRLDLDSMVSREIGLEEVEEAFGWMERGEVIKSVIRFP